MPDARVVMAHGQMKERELEATMVRFVTGQADILVSTAIVESGLDIPASNTIIVNRADRFGLAQLYQLRGRVGRERQQAYAYLLVSADGRVDEQAQRRLRVLQELTELGSGFKLAMRDLEIRGAGNLLGPEQHGHIAAVGYDLYSKLLGEAVRELRGEPAAATVEPVISIDAEGLLPEEYVPEVNQRLALYKRLAAAESAETVAELRAELTDRFGPLPAVAEQLLDTVRIRVAARALAIEKIEVGEGKALITFAPSTSIDPQRLVHAIQRSRGRLRLKREFTVEAAVARGAVAHGARLGAAPARGAGRGMIPAVRAGRLLRLIAVLALTGRMRRARLGAASSARRARRRPTAATAEPAPVEKAEANPVPPPAPTNRLSLDDDSVSDRVVAVVNNDAITLMEVQESIVAAKQDNSAALPPDERAGQGVSGPAHRHAAAAPGGGPGEDHRRRGGGRRGAGRAPEEVPGCPTRPQFEEALKAQGMSLDSVKRRIREGIRMGKVVRRKVTLRVSVNDQEITQYLEQNRGKLEQGLPYHARNILMVPDGDRPSDAAWEGARIRADVIRQQIVAGADFAEMARQHSRDASAKDGGDLGTLKRGELAVDIENEILKLAPGAGLAAVPVVPGLPPVQAREQGDAGGRGPRARAPADPGHSLP